jgi:hypothetical protein
VTEDAVVNEVVDSTGVQYALIAGLRIETGPERLVIAYSNEKALRALIATPSIIAVGFSSREEALAGRRASVPAISHRRIPQAIAGAGTERDQQGVNGAERRGEIGSSLRRLARFLVTSYGDLATTATAVFFSRNAVSAVIRI